jgi:hypothetical protein
MACGAFLAAAAGLHYYQRHSTIFFLHSASDLHAQYPLPRAKESSRLFDDFYVVKDGATDCSFVAVLMLMLQRDPTYGLVNVRETADGYYVRFPVLPAPVLVSKADVQAHHAHWEESRETYSRFWPGHIPAGLEILRTAYYNRQAEIGLRGRKGDVHGGGSPAQDLIMLSGVRKSHSIIALCPGSSPYEASFGSCPAQRFETTLGNDGKSFVSVETGSFQAGNPMDTIGLRDNQLVILTTSVNVPSWLGTRLVPYHAYYLLGRSPDGSYVLGNPYQTRRPILVTPAEFMKHFLSVDFVNLDGSSG